MSWYDGPPPSVGDLDEQELRDFAFATMAANVCGLRTPGEAYDNAVRSLTTYVPYADVPEAQTRLDRAFAAVYGDGGPGDDRTAGDVLKTLR